MNETISMLLTYETSLRTIATILGIGGAVTGTAFLIPSIIDKIRPLSKQDRLSDYLPFISILPNGSHIKCVNNRYISIVEIKGAEITMASFEERVQKYYERKLLLDQIEKTSVEDIRFISFKERHKIDPNVKQENPVLGKITNDWNSSFTNIYKTRHYAVITVKESNDDTASNLLHTIEEQVVRTLSSYKCRVLSENPGSPENGPMAMLANLISPISKPTPLGKNILDKNDFSQLLTADRIDFSEDLDGILKFSNGRETKYASIIGIRDCGEKTSENAMKDILSLDAELIVYQSIKPLNSQIQKVELTREALSAPLMTLSPSASYEFQDVIHLIDGMDADNRATHHHYALNIIVYGETIEEIHDIESEIISIIAPTGATCIRELIAAQATWFSLFPADTLWPRRFRFLSSNISTNLALQKTTPGRSNSDWSKKPITYFRNIATGEAYQFNFHSEEGKQTVPHCVSIGPTGTGKTTFVTFLASQALAIPDLSVYLFDRLNGCEVFTRCAGGQYLTFDRESSINLNPLYLPDTGGNRAFLQSWLGILGNRQGPEDDEQISQLISINYYKDPNGKTFPNKIRKLESYHKAVFRPGSHLKKAFEPWVDQNQLGRYFNGDEDTLDLTKSRLIGLDMTVILDDPRLSVPMVDYIVHRIRMNSGYDTSANNANSVSRPSLIFIDETEPMLSNTHFKDRILKVGLQEGRKMRQAFILAFQRPEAIKNTGISELVRGQCQTAFFYRNPSAKPEDYSDWGLNDTELSFVLGEAYKDHKYAVLVKNYKMGESVILDVNLAALGNYMRVFSSGRPQVIEMNKAINKYGPNKFIEPFINGEFETT